MVSSMKYALALAIIAAVACTAYGINCYTCDSERDHKCGEKFDAQSHFKQDCANVAPNTGAQFTQSFQNLANGHNPFGRANATGCMKRLFNLQNGQHRIERSCFFGDVNHHDTGCRDISQAFNTQQMLRCDVCTGNYCNGSSAMAPIGFAIALFFVLARVFS